MNDRIADTRQCPYCRQWIAMPARRQREAFNAHKLGCREIAGVLERNPATPHYAPGHCRDCNDETARRDAEADRPTVKRPDLFGNVIDSYRTESELNGWKATQGALL